MTMSDKIMGELFGSKTKARILKLFLHSPNLVLSPQEIGARIGAKKQEVKKSLASLIKLDIITSSKRNGKNQKKKTKKGAPC